MEQGANALIDELRSRLRQELPGASAQRRMAPEHRLDLDAGEIRARNCREAAVLALLYPVQDDLRLVLTVRPDHLPDHAGQISFPGGRCEPGEQLHETALREAQEEIGLAPETVDILGRLTPLYIPPSNFFVHPFVGYSPFKPSLRATAAEVDQILHVPVDALFSGQAVFREAWTLHGSRVMVPYFRFGSHRIWGATAMMLAELEDVIGDVCGRSVRYPEH